MVEPLRDDQQGLPEDPRLGKTLKFFSDRLGLPETVKSISELIAALPPRNPNDPEVGSLTDEEVREILLNYPEGKKPSRQEKQLDALMTEVGLPEETKFDFLDALIDSIPLEEHQKMYDDIVNHHKNNPGENQ